jgi:hypothetical protein
LFGSRCSIGHFSQILLNDFYNQQHIFIKNNIPNNKSTHERNE